MKIILLIFFIYIALQVLRILFRTRVVIKNFNYTDNRGQHRQKAPGEVTITSPADRKNKKNTDQLGEYVDYEEV